MWIDKQPILKGAQSIEEHFDLKGPLTNPVFPDETFKSMVLDEIKDKNPLEAKYDDYYITLLNRLTKEHEDFDFKQQMMFNTEYDQGPHRDILSQRLFPKSRVIGGIGIMVK